MDTIFAARLLDLSNKPLTKENFIALYRAIKAPYVEEEIENLINTINGRALDELINEGMKKMACFAAPVAVQSKQEEKPAQEATKAPVVDEEEDEDFDMFGGL